MSEIKSEYSNKWTSGELEFDSQSEAVQYYIDNDIFPSNDGDEFVRVEKLIIKVGE